MDLVRDALLKVELLTIVDEPSGDTVEIQGALKFYTQDVALGMDTYCLRPTGFADRETAASLEQARRPRRTRCTLPFSGMKAGRSMKTSALVVMLLGVAGCAGGSASHEAATIRGAASTNLSGFTPKRSKLSTVFPLKRFEAFVDIKRSEARAKINMFLLFQWDVLLHSTIQSVKESFFLDSHGAHQFELSWN